MRQRRSKVPGLKSEIQFSDLRLRSQAKELNFRPEPEIAFGIACVSHSLRDQQGTLRAWIENHDLRRVFQLDFDSRVYTASPIPYYGGRVGFKPRRRDRHRPSGRTVHVRTETIDTGERREMFGYTARRVIIRTKIRYSPDIDGRYSDTEADCWYIDPPPAWLALHPPTPGHAILQAVVNGRVDTPEFTDIGPCETGFPLLVKRTHRSTLKDPRRKPSFHAGLM